MSIASQLDALQTNFESCRIALYADLSTKMVLSSSCDRPVPQEQLDMLCGRAAEILNGASSKTAAMLLSPSEGPRIAEVVSMQGDAVYVTVRSANDPDEAICCLCSTDMDLSQFVAALRTKLVETEE